LWQIAHDHEPF